MQLYILGFHYRICVKFSTCLPEFVHVREHGLAMIFNHSSFEGFFRYGQGGCLCRQLFLVTKDPLFAQVHCCEALLLRVISLGCIRCQLHKLKISSSLSISLQAMSELRSNSIQSIFRSAKASTNVCRSSSSFCLLGESGRLSVGGCWFCLNFGQT